MRHAPSTLRKGLDAAVCGDEPSMIGLSEIRFGYDAHTGALFENLSLEVPAGSITAILGPNGAGKSSLLYLVLGMLKPNSGTIRLNQRPRHSYTRRELGRLVALVSQEETVPFSFTVLEYVILGRAPYLTTLGVPRAGGFPGGRASSGPAGHR